MKTEGLPTRVACRVLEVSESGFYAWRTRPPSARSIPHAWLTDLIHQIHQQSRGTYGALRVHAEQPSVSGKLRAIHSHNPLVRGYFALVGIGHQTVTGSAG